MNTIQITKQVRVIEVEPFEPTEIIIRVIDSNDEATNIYVELTQHYSAPNPGSTIRRRNFTVPTSMIESLQLDWKGNAGNHTALAAVLSQFNLIEYIPPIEEPQPTE